MTIIKETHDGSSDHNKAEDEHKKKNNNSTK